MSSYFFTKFPFQSFQQEDALQKQNWDLPVLSNFLCLKVNSKSPLKIYFPILVMRSFI